MRKVIKTFQKQLDSGNLEYSDDFTTVSPDGSRSSSFSFFRCNDPKMSLAMRFKRRKNADQVGEDLQLSFGISYSPSNAATPAYAATEGLHLGQTLNSWGLVHKQFSPAENAKLPESSEIVTEAGATDDIAAMTKQSSSFSTVLGINGERSFAIEPLLRVGRIFDESDEICLDVDFLQSSAVLHINNVFMHAFTLSVCVHVDSGKCDVALEDFIIGCVFTAGVEVTIVAERLHVPDSRVKVAKAIFKREHLEQELIAAGLVEGLEFRGKPKLLQAAELKQSPHEKRRNKQRLRGMHKAYRVEVGDMQNDIIQKLIRQPKKLVPLSALSPLRTNRHASALGFYFPCLEAQRSPEKKRLPPLPDIQQAYIKVEAGGVEAREERQVEKQSLLSAAAGEGVGLGSKLEEEDEPANGNRRTSCRHIISVHEPPNLTHLYSYRAQGGSNENSQP